MKVYRAAAALLLAVMLTAAPALAESRKLTPDEVKTLTIKAADLIAAQGLEQAEKVFNQEGDYKFGEIYVNVIDLAGNWVVYPPKPENKGKTVLPFVDEDGKQLGQEILATGLKGEGWVEYRWKNPAANAIQQKVTYVKKVPGKDYITYIGIYK